MPFCICQKVMEEDNFVWLGAKSKAITKFYLKPHHPHTIITIIHPQKLFVLLYTAS